MKIPILFLITKIWGWLLGFTAGATVLIIFSEKILKPVKFVLTKMRLIINRPAMVMANQILEALEGIKLSIDKSNSRIEDLADSQEYIALLNKVVLDKSDAMYFRADKDGMTVEISPATIRILGWPPEGLMGLNWLNKIPEEQHARIIKSFEESKKYSKSVDHTYDFKTGYGTILKIRTQVELSKSGNNWVGTHSLVQGSN